MYYKLRSTLKTYWLKLIVFVCIFKSLLFIRGLLVSNGHMSFLLYMGPVSKNSYFAVVSEKASHELYVDKYQNLNISIVKNSDSYVPFTVNSNICQEDSFLLIAIISSPENVHYRNKIRQSWHHVYKDSSEQYTTHSKPYWNTSQGLHDHFRVNHVFAIGQTNSEVSKKWICKEMNTYGDILLGNFSDTYHNLTTKSIMLFQWFTKYCSNARFLIKVDDNIHVNLPLLLGILNNVTHVTSDFIMGHVKIRANLKPIRKEKFAKWYMPESMYPEESYPRYVDGPAYAMPNHTALKLLPACISQPPVHFEDLFITGICRTKAKVNLWKDVRICHWIAVKDVRHFPKSCATEHRAGKKTRYVLGFPSQTF